MWTKVSSKRLKKRTSPAVAGYKNHHQKAFIFPFDWPVAARANVYSDGNGKLAVEFAADGDLAVAKSGNCHRVTIPSQYAERIPVGTTDVELARDGDLWVLDLNTLN